MKLALLALVFLAAHVSADIYLHMPRGSNNRLDDENRDRNNANRLFDSQNNNRGGVNVGSLYYYTGSKVLVEWTAQHSCGNPNNNCELVFQYYCDDRMRDGTTTNTIPDDPNQCYNWDCDTDPEYGRHESYDWYQQCKYRMRNMGLFTSAQDLNGNDARFTRQNPNGARRGYECPEERDYYPYWYPVPWYDIAVFTNQPGRCAAYQAESQNVKGRAYCKAPAMLTYENRNRNAWLPITQEECEAIMPYWNSELNITEVAEWAWQNPWGIDPPVCHENMWSRDNHHGNVWGGWPANFNWTVPDFVISDQCVLRMRYNISTGDYEEWLEVDGQETVQANYVNASLNHDQRGASEYPAWVDIWSQYGLTYEDVRYCFENTMPDNDDAQKGQCREYVLVDNPKVDIFGELLGTTSIPKFQLAVNTAQFGRTFEDRTHIFGIKQKPGNIDTTIHNLNVRGKRGNIVQTFPSTEYDFAPTNLNVRVNDFIHFQWSGSNTNPNNNAGQGRQGSDRHNAVLIRPAVYAEEGHIVDNAGNIWQDTAPLTTWGQYGRSYPDRIDQGVSFAGFSYDVMMMLALSGKAGMGFQYGGEVSELDDAGTYFDAGPQRASQKGIYHYLCTRNNNFSNRDQKAKIVVSDSSEETALIGALGGSIKAGSVTVTFSSDQLEGLTSITITESPKSTPSSLSDVTSSYITIAPHDLSGAKFTAKLNYEDDPLATPSVYHSQEFQGTWTLIGNAKFDSGKATFTASEGGIYAVSAPVNYGAVIGIAIAVCAVAGAGLFFGLRWYRNKHSAGAGTINAVA